MTRAVPPSHRGLSFASLGFGALAVFALSCSEGPGLIPYGGAQFTTAQSINRPEGTGCPVFGSTMSIGDPPPSLTRDDAGSPLADGTQGTKVSCRVRGKDEIEFSGLIGGISATDPEQKYGELRLIGGKIGPDGTGTFEASLSTPVPGSASNLNLSSAADTPCTVTGVTQAGEKQYGDGLLWARFVCPAMVRGVSDYCRTDGVVVFENCDH